MLPILRRNLRDSRRALVWWSLGVLGYVSLISAVWPVIRDNPALKTLHETYPEAFKAFVSFGGEFDFSTASGFLAAELFSLVLPLLLLIAAIAAGARVIAGEEEAHTLDLLLANPVSRTRLALEKLVVVVIELIVLVAVLWVALVVCSYLFDLDVSAGHFLAAVVSAGLIALAFGAIATAVGAATGRRVMAIAVSAALALASYLVNALSPLVPAIERIRWLSPWYHYASSDALRAGLDAGHALTLVAIFAVAAVLVPVAFARRDLA